MILKNLVKAALGLSLLCSVFCDARSQTRRHIQVSGRAVDRKGQPVRQVTATLDVFPCRGCPKDVVPSNRSMDDGVFFVDTTLSADQYLVLYLREIEPVGFWSPIGGSPYSRFAHLPEFRGIRIRPPRNSLRVDLEDVEVKILFGKVILKVPESWNALGSESALELRLQDRTGTLVYDDDLPLSAANANSSSVKLALTPGRWKVQLLMRHNGQRFRSAVRSIVVKPANCEIVSLTNRSHPEPCNNSGGQLPNLVHGLTVLAIDRITNGAL